MVEQPTTIEPIKCRNDMNVMTQTFDKQNNLIKLICTKCGRHVEAPMDNPMQRAVINEGKKGMGGMLRDFILKYGKGASQVKIVEEKKFDPSAKT